MGVFKLANFNPFRKADAEVSVANNPVTTDLKPNTSEKVEQKTKQNLNTVTSTPVKSAEKAKEAVPKVEILDKQIVLIPIGKCIPGKKKIFKRAVGDCEFEFHIHSRLRFPEGCVILATVQDCKCGDKRYFVIYPRPKVVKVKYELVADKEKEVFKFTKLP